MATSIIAKTVAASVAACATEMIVGQKLGLLAVISPLGVPAAFCGVIGANVVASTMTLLALGFKVGAARQECGIELPTMYATGTDEKSVKFNCVQRGHQQALETYTRCAPAGPSTEAWQELTAAVRPFPAPRDTSASWPPVSSAASRTLTS